MPIANEECPAELPNWCARRHWAIFWILIVCSVATVAGKVLSLGEGISKEGKPFFSANDRSRWVTVRALGDHGRFEIDSIIQSDDGRHWDTIDKVRHVGADGQFHFYSSKPPLLSVITAGGYALLKLITGWELAIETVWVVRTLLFFVNVIPWAIYLWFVARMINSVPVRDWTRYYILACACFATYLIPFTITLNNHLPAAVAVMVSLYCVSEIIRIKRKRWLLFAGTGLFGGLAAAMELPALSFWAIIGLICAIYSIRQTLLGFLPASLFVLAAALATNWWAFGQFYPPYFQRQDGPVLATIRGDFDNALNTGQLPPDLRLTSGLDFPAPVVEPGQWPSTPPEQLRWVVRDQSTVSQVAIVRDTQIDPPIYEVRQWGNWYDYPNSYWLTDNDKRKSKVDLGIASVELYAFHLLFGHHGLFSLTPIWLLSLAGMVALIGGAKLAGRFQMRWLGMIGLVLSLVVFSFYLTRPEMDRNYGGYCCTARWLLWLTPIWLMCMIPVVDWLGGSRWGKCVCFVLMLISIVSATVPANNPWTLPWLYQIWEYTGLPF